MIGAAVDAQRARLVAAWCPQRQPLVAGASRARSRADGGQSIRLLGRGAAHSLMRCGAAFAGQRGPSRAVARGLGRSAANSSQPVAAWLTRSVLRTAVRPVLAWWRSASSYGGSADTATIVASCVKASPCGGGGTRGWGASHVLRLLAAGAAQRGAVACFCAVAEVQCGARGGPPLCGSASRAREPMAGSLGRPAQAQRTCAARRGVCWPAGTVCSAR